MDYDEERKEPAAEDTTVSPPAPPEEPSLVPAEVAQNLQSKAERYKNIADALQAELVSKQQQIAQLNSEKRRQLIAELGDNPTVQQMATQLEKLEHEAAELEAEKQRLLPVRKIADAQELAEKYGVNPKDLEEAQSYAEMEGMAKVLAKSKAAPPSTPKTEPSKKPAVPFTPDSGVTSARKPSDFETLEDRYVKGEIPLKEYRKAREEKGLS